MALALQIAITLALLIVCCFAPGFFVVRRLRWSPLEKLCGSVGLSVILLYLVAWEYYCFVPDAGVWNYAAVSAISVALGIIARKDIAALVRTLRVRQSLFGYLFLLVWTLLFLGMIRVYSGAGWGGDWAEHFQRTLFFLHHFPANTPIVGGYVLPARPPLMNVVGAFFLAQTQDRFEIFQIVYSFLNLLMFLPCCLIMPALGGPRRHRILPLVALFALNPVVMQATTYSWPRGLTTFFVISGIALYLAGWRKRDPVRMTAAFIAISAGILTHYSAGPYAVFIGLHYVVCVFRRRPGKWRELRTITVSCVLLLSTWFGWSIATYGVHVTLASNTTVTDSEAYEGSTVEKIAANIYHSTVPAVVRAPSSVHYFDQPSRLGFIRDNFFIFYESNVLFSMGLVAGPMVLGLLWRLFRRPGGAERRFVLAFIPFTIIFGIAVVGPPDIFGVAHVTLLALEVLGLTMLAGARPLRKIATAVLIAGTLVDFSAGVLLHARIEGLENSPSETFFANPAVMQDGQFLVPYPLPPGVPSMFTWNNWTQKHQYFLSQEWQHLAGVREAAVLKPELARMANDDDEFWHGWYKRNGGSIVYLGDHLASLSFDGSGTLQMLVLVLFGVLTWKLRQQMSSK